MLPKRTGSVLPSVLILAACGVADTAPPPVAAEPVTAREPVDSLVSEPAPPPPEPEPSLEERWRAPFAVASRGRPAARTERMVVVRGDPGARPASAGGSRRETDRDEVVVVGPAEAELEGPDPDAAPEPAAPQPERAAETRPARSDDPGPRTHEVSSGETWYGIARRYRISPSALESANPGADPERIRPGQVLRIPPEEVSDSDRRTHAVKAGDSLWGIARRYGVTMEQIRAANRLEGDRVRIGQTLIIPKAEDNR